MVMKNAGIVATHTEVQKPHSMRSLKKEPIFTTRSLNRENIRDLQISSVAPSTNTGAKSNRAIVVNTIIL